MRAKAGLDAVRTSVCGAAPIPTEVLDYFIALGLRVQEVWGMSELSAVATINPADALRVGSVGKPLPGVEVALAEDGELLCRGPIVMRGYRKQPDKTAETIDPDGWLHTGDIAEIDADGEARHPGPLSVRPCAPAGVATSAHRRRSARRQEWLRRGRRAPARRRCARAPETWERARTRAA